MNKGRVGSDDEIIETKTESGDKLQTLTLIQ